LLNKPSSRPRARHEGRAVEKEKLTAVRLSKISRQPTRKLRKPRVLHDGSISSR